MKMTSRSLNFSSIFTFFEFQIISIQFDTKEKASYRQVDTYDYTPTTTRSLSMNFINVRFTNADWYWWEWWWWGRWWWRRTKSGERILDSDKHSSTKGEIQGTKSGGKNLHNGFWNSKNRIIGEQNLEQNVGNEFGTRKIK